MTGQKSKKIVQRERDLERKKDKERDLAEYYAQNWVPLIMGSLRPPSVGNPYAVSQ
jgi:hypothetical protein